MGKAGTPYARSVQQITALPDNALPDPGLIFDTLLRREKVRFRYRKLKVLTDCMHIVQFVPHPAGLSSMMFSFAALVIHTYVQPPAYKQLWC